MKAVSHKEKSFDALVDGLRGKGDLVGLLSPSAFIKAIQTDIQTFSAEAKVHRNTVSRSPSSEQIQRFLRESLRVLRAATDISGDYEKAIFWYNNEPISIFDYKTPRMLVAEGKTENLLRYVQSLEAGARG